MKQKIIDILNDHSSEVTIRGSIVTDGEKEDWLWSGEFEEVADKILLILPKSATPYQICPKCMGDGDLLRYNSPAVLGTNSRPICDTCQGKKVILMGC